MPPADLHQSHQAPDHGVAVAEGGRGEGVGDGRVDVRTVQGDPSVPTLHLVDIKVRVVF